MCLSLLSLLVTLTWYHQRTAGALPVGLCYVQQIYVTSYCDVFMKDVSDNHLVGGNRIAVGVGITSREVKAIALRCELDPMALRLVLCIHWCDICYSTQT